MSVAVNWGDPRLPETFWGKCIPEPNSGCWIWTAYAQPTDKGFLVPKFSFTESPNIKRLYCARKYAYLKCVDDAFDGYIVSNCAVDLCCNPAHVTPKRTRYGVERKRRLKEVTDEWRDANRARLRAKDLFKKYGLTQERFDQMLRDQGEACAICETKFHADLPANVDHCHRTGRIRSLLCRLCNVGIGHFSDDEEKLIRALDYLRRHRAEDRR